MNKWLLDSWLAFLVMAVWTAIGFVAGFIAAWGVYVR